MRPEDAISHFGTQHAVAAIVGVSRGAVSLWKGRVPDLHQLKLERASGGVLKADKAAKALEGTLRALLT
jgi:DNA-binding transcriptional regulator YdaS (Cro superfamily)